MRGTTLYAVWVAAVTATALTPVCMAATLFMYGMVWQPLLVLAAGVLPLLVVTACEPDVDMEGER